MALLQNGAKEPITGAGRPAAKSKGKKKPTGNEWRAFLQESGDEGIVSLEVDSI